MKGQLKVITILITIAFSICSCNCEKKANDAKYELMINQYVNSLVGNKN